MRYYCSMDKNIELKKQATILRKQGLSYGDISKKIGAPKSTLSSWLKDIELSTEQRKHLYTKQIGILNLGAKSQRERRAKEIKGISDAAQEEIRSPLSRQTFLMMGAAMYWAEGSKTKAFEITNSDPAFILFMIEWMKEVFEVEAKNLKARLNIYSQQDDHQVKQFWADLTGIPLEHFGKSYIKPTNKGYKKNTLYYGTIKIVIPKSSDKIHQVHGWIKGALKISNIKVESVERKWGALRRVPRPLANLEQDYKNSCRP